MQRKEAAAYFLQSPTKLIQYVCFNNPDGVAELLDEQFPHIGPAEGFNSETELASACLQAGSEYGSVSEFAVMLANSVVPRRKPTNSPNKWADIKAY